MVLLPGDAVSVRFVGSNRKNYHGDHLATQGCHYGNGPAEEARPALSAACGTDWHYGRRSFVFVTLFFAVF